MCEYILIDKKLIMAQFISIPLSGNVGNQFLNGKHLVAIEHIISIEQTAAQTISIHLDNFRANFDEIELTFSTLNDSSAVVNPVYSKGAPLMEAFNNILGGSPGVDRSSDVKYGRDDNNNPVYCVNLIYR